MEKSSEKVIGSNKLALNPFNNLMSEVQIKLNQPKSLKKIDNYALQIDSNIDKSNSNINQLPHAECKKANHSEGNSKITHHNVFVINAPLKTKHSSDTLSKEKSEKQIIDQWIIGYMNKRQILGTHWQSNLAEKQRMFLEMAFKTIKQQSKLEKIKKIYSLNEKVCKFAELFDYLESTRIKQFFTILKQYYKDDLLFGLSNTMGEERDHSHMLKIESDYESLSVQSKNFKRQPQNKKFQQYSFSNESQSNKNMNKKISDSGSVSEDLSNLILNHNKLKLSDELNKSTPNIPRAKNSQKNIKTNKEIGELCMETNKQISTQRKLSEEQKNYDLPLQSNKNIVHTKKDISETAGQIQAKGKSGQDNQPITITFILNNLNNGLAKEQITSQIKQPSKKQMENLKNPSQKNIFSDQYIMNKLPFTESFYQNIGGNAKQVPFIHHDNQKRSTSLQVKPGYVPLFPQKIQNCGNNGSIKRLPLNQYYPQQHNRQNAHFIKQNNPIIQKVRPKSATPKITFTFTNSTNMNMNKIVIPSNGLFTRFIPSRVSSINNVLSHPYENHDCIVESILTPQNQIVKEKIGPQRAKYQKLQVVSPSRNAESPKRMAAPNKMALDNREHIKINLLPPAFNDYGVQNLKGEKTLKNQKSNGKIVVMDNEIVYSEAFQNSTAHNSLFGCSPRQSNLNYQSKEQVRMRSPKDKIFVTYANHCNI